MSLAPAGAAFLLALAVTLHNIEEMIWLPGFAHPPALKLEASAAAFRFAAIVVAAVFWLAALALWAGWPVAAILAGFALAMIVNAVVPHLALTLLLRRYHPGAATAALLVVPASLIYLVSVGGLSRLGDPAFLAGAVAGLAALAASVPALLALGGRFEPLFRGRR